MKPLSALPLLLGIAALAGLGLELSEAPAEGNILLR